MYFWLEDPVNHFILAELLAWLQSQTNSNKIPRANHMIFVVRVMLLFCLLASLLVDLMKSDLYPHLVSSVQYTLLSL